MPSTSQHCWMGACLRNETQKFEENAILCFFKVSVMYIVECSLLSVSWVVVDVETKEAPSAVLQHGSKSAFDSVW